MEGKVKRYFMLERVSWKEVLVVMCNIVHVDPESHRAEFFVVTTPYSYAPLVLWQREIDDCNSSSSSSPPQPL